MEQKRSKESCSLHVTMFPFLAFGHIAPFVNLSNKLISHGVRISFLSTPATAPRIATMLNPAADIITLPLPPVDGLPPGAEATSDLTPLQAELVKQAVDMMQPQIRQTLSSLRPHLVVFDFAQDWLPNVAADLGIKTAILAVYTAVATAFLIVPARLPAPGTYPSLDQLRLPPPGLPKTSITSVATFQARDFLYLFKSFHGLPCVYDRVHSGLTGCSAIIAKTCIEMESPYIEYVRSQLGKPMLLAGPLLPESRTNEPLDGKWDEWLSRFEAKSVIFSSFGSETFLSNEQIRELSTGLELTGLPFLLVLNFPREVNASEALNKALPERVEGKGVIATGWVQQQQILAHPSVGCYVCHGGYSSVIEGIISDCQIVMVPQKGDQFLNSRLVSGDLKAGVEVYRRDEDGYFGREDVRVAVESVMVRVEEEPGKSVRANHKKWNELLTVKSFEDKLMLDLVTELEKIAGISC